GVKFEYSVLNPAASAISWIVLSASLAMARSLSPCEQSTCNMGMPQASTLFGSMATLFSLRGSISHQAPSQNGISLGFSRTSFLNDAPKPGVCLACENEYPWVQPPCIP